MLMNELLTATWQTVYMTVVSGFIASIVGIPLGILLFISGEKGLWRNTMCNRSIAFIVNTLRSVPFIILLVALIPLTRLITGTSIGTTAAIVPLSIGAIPFVARMIENILMDLPYGLIEAGLAMGATIPQIIQRILIPEALPAIINCLTVTLISLVGYTAMAGAVGGGGLGDLAIHYGYQRFDTMVMLATVLILIVLVQTLQYMGDTIAQKFNYRQRREQ